jgi:hypothetical protein
MDNMSNLLFVAIPALGLLALGAIWLMSYVFKEVSLKDEHDESTRVGQAAARAEGLALQCAIAEDLEADPATLNALAQAVTLAREDVEVAQNRQIADRTKEPKARLNPGLAPSSTPRFSPVAAIHGFIPKPGESPSHLAK